ncbi:Na+/H+ antiporter subunit G [Roseobacter sp. HKCCD9010]|uniref:Na+/H+ antiporter subunit G n=1 Tax=unclassified Roseobacter TaxID=196798 RepID=UPI0014915A0D|nr:MULTISPECIES: Na+/H+ antiporter subunit G [unclassified Roseobacter]MBF9051525.1 Na+/H+ antiporter subunit G [Rhodobacterales bacterium HKCCD4356]NNV13049.1 Na+/H+ antiporter subunit G [Roseobacter sp. HKCCD7357]NNV17300.1 Na+/H+ antiporter subunit G [Roseobacter sp. HKCCD8768]NNV26906.1 Na+/H+ antiporter subunit G [Roseobacter sp. HKCCD8192]NNV31026.1 Na+/H+ antiporter subunit G [Roseobacter sp. HKCCD9061]
MSFIAELLIALSLVVSGFFGFVGSYGLVKLKDTVQRLHAPTKATTLGVGGVLAASLIFFYAETGHISVHELLISVFLFLTAPITANFIAKAYLARNLRKDQLPDSASEYGWSVYDDPPDGASDK